MLILVFDAHWGHPLGQEDMIEGVEITTDRSRFAEADVVICHLPEWKEDRITAIRPWSWELKPKKRPGQIWVGCSLECEDHYPVMRDARFMQHFDLTMTYRLDSDIPTTYAIPFGSVANMLSALRRPPPPKTEDAPLVSFISSDVDRNDRRAYLYELSRYIAIDSYGKFLNNRRLPTDRGRESKLDVIGAYRFTIAFENARSNDYVTEKLFDAFWAGSVPVYFGAPNVEKFVPGSNCYIDASRFADPKDLAEHLKRLASDEAAYQRLFAWKQRPLRSHFLTLIEREARPPLTRLSELILGRLGDCAAL
ncbi:alpha-1,3-fucosyltransferase [Labrys sp. LIt4]|uniref:glycosyltransferase family 10 domain-containing protein n=1 Tax=Labrys sp. LIt4 TaxID=2821355 RepID=UPI001AE02F50|nr:glycosyltransferase family 10 [Labrys sp. LIt4]MBP0581879.1 alpha-1,3-fucosyltransferase [Labrys sp. LIt4]